MNSIKNRIIKEEEEIQKGRKRKRSKRMYDENNNLLNH
jgi:hypothetical protein